MIWTMRIHIRSCLISEDFILKRKLSTTKILIVYIIIPDRNEDHEDKLFFLFRTALKNDDAASLNMCNVYVAQRSKPSLSKYESLFFHSILFLFLLFSSYDACRQYLMLHFIYVYTWSTFSFFSIFILNKNKKKKPNL